MKVVALIPSHNEEIGIAQTIKSLLDQTRVPDEIVVICDNCTDDTEKIASSFPITVIKTENNKHRKSGAMNMAWAKYCQDADYVLTMDADSYFPPESIENWEKEMDADPTIGGSSGKFTVQEPGFFGRMQKAEFAHWIGYLLKKGTTPVMAGTCTFVRNDLLKQIEGPWNVASKTEDFFLTCEINKLGYKCVTSPTVRCYTDGMKDLRSLYSQRMKWQTGTLEDLRTFGFTRMTAPMWWGQAKGFLSILSRLLWLFVTLGLAMTHQLHYSNWWLLIPALTILASWKKSFLIPHRDWKDSLLAVSFFPIEAYNLIRTAYFLNAWVAFLSGSKKDRWALQYQTETRK